MTTVGRALREKFSADATHERLTAAMKRQVVADMVEVPYEWQTAQSRDAIKFPTYGWVPMTAVAWVSAVTGERLPWTSGRDGDTFLMDRRYARAA
jgi:hypothetical protein